MARPYRIKFVNFFLLLLCICYACTRCTASIEIPVFSTPLTKAAVSVILKFFTLKTTLISITRASSQYDHYFEQSDIITDILYHTKSHLVYRLEAVNKTSRVPETSKRRYNVIFIDDFDSFRKIFTTDTIKNYDVTGYYLLIITSYNKERPLVTIEAIFKYAFNAYITNINVLLMNPDMDKSALMYTYFPFSGHSCSDTTPVISNIFVADRFIRAENFYPSKVREMHNCPLFVATFSTPPYMQVDGNTDGTYRLSGFEAYLIKTLEKRLNFELVVKLPEKGEKWGELFRNGSRTGALRMIADNEANLTIGAFGLSQARLSLMDPTINYFQSDLVLVIPPGKPYTPFEKLFLPFEKYVWMLIISQFIFGVVVICMLKFVTQPIRNFIIGRANTYPILGMMSAFFGVPMCYMPTRNFARTLAMIWMLGCIVIRGSYQGSLFNYLQVQKNFSAADTMDKMIENDFKFYVAGAGSFYFDSMPNVVDRVVSFPPNKRAYYWDRVRDPNFKGTILSSRAHVAWANYEHSHENPYLTGSQHIMLFPVTMYVRKGSYLTSLLNKEIDAYMSAGLVDFWMNAVIDERYFKEQKKTQEPVKMSYNHIAGGYQMCMMFYGVSLVFFCLELLSKYFSGLRRFLEFVTY